MRVVLITGKGGAGKTTTAASTAVAAARRGVKTLVMSVESAPSLGNVLGVDLSVGWGADPAVEVEPGLSALHVGASEAGRSWHSVHEYVVGVLHVLGVDTVLAEELTSLPGAREVVALMELRRQVDTGPWDLVVVDCPSSAETLRLLALPESLGWHVERLMPAQRGVWRSLRPALAAASGLPVPGPDVVVAMRRWHEQLRELQAVLASDTTSLRLVLTPERAAVADSRRTLSALRLYGFGVDQVVVNRVFPTSGPDALGGSWTGSQQRALELAREAFAAVPVVVSPVLPDEPVGPDALAALAGTWSPDAADILAPVARPELRVVRVDGGYVLSLPLEAAAPADVDLKRRNDDLLVTVDGHRRILPLPSVLRRCLVTRAAVRDGALDVSFAPDPALWPAGPQPQPPPETQPHSQTQSHGQTQP